MGDSLPGLQARLMSQALRKLTASISKTQTLVIFINQIRHKIGISYGSPEVTSGGNALKFYASVRLDIRRIGSVKLRDEVIGNSTRVKVVKNKVAPPFREVEFEHHVRRRRLQAGRRDHRPGRESRRGGKNRAPGIRGTASASARAGTTPGNTSRPIPRSPIRSSSRCAALR